MNGLGALNLSRGVGTTDAESEIFINKVCQKMSALVANLSHGKQAAALGC